MFNLNFIMKKILFLIVLVTTLIGCNKEYYGKCEQVYDHHTLPALSKTDYNDCDKVAINYIYFYRYNNAERYLNRHPNPYEANEGDTIKIKGFIMHTHNRTVIYDGDNWTCDMGIDSLSAMDPEYHTAWLSLEGTDKALLNGIDFTKKCYVTAIITFHTMFPMSGSPSDLRSCAALYPVYKVVEIKN